MDMYLREATLKDSELIFEWANEEEVRKNSFHTDKITLEEHQNWFQMKLQAKDSYIFIFYYQSQPAGIVRLEVQDAEGIISYSLDREYRGKGLSKDMLALLEQKTRETRITNRLIGYVKFENKASQSIFEKLGYEKITEIDRLKYQKAI